MASFARIGFVLLSCLLVLGRIAGPQSLVHFFTWWNLTSDVNDHRSPFPALHERLLSQMSIERFFNHLDAPEVHDPSIGLQTAIARHAWHIAFEFGVAVQ